MAVEVQIDVSPEQLRTVQDILARHVSDREVWAFGSRVSWTANDTSDLDLVVRGEGALPFETLCRLERDFEESDLPFEVDILDWHTIPDHFHPEINECYVPVTRPNERLDCRIEGFLSVPFRFVKLCHHPMNQTNRT